MTLKPYQENIIERLLENKTASTVYFSIIERLTKGGALDELALDVLSLIPLDSARYRLGIAQRKTDGFALVCHLGAEKDFRLFGNASTLSKGEIARSFNVQEIFHHPNQVDENALLGLWLYHVDDSDIAEQLKGWLTTLAPLMALVLERFQADTYLFSSAFDMDARLAQTVFDTTTEAIMVTDVSNVIVAVNPSFTQVTGYSAQEVLGKDPGFLSSGRHNGEFYRRMWQQLRNTGRWQGEIWNRRKNGDPYAEWLSIAAVENDQGVVDRYVAIFSDITKRKRAEEMIRQQVNYDSLTGLPNRNLFMDRLSRAVMRAKRDRGKAALFFLDLDRFKTVNDSLGYNVGDTVLQEAANRLVSCVRKSDTVSRLSGDEFAIVASEITSNSADRIACTILEAMQEPFLLEGEEVFLSASLGITFYPDDGLEIETLLRNADTAMYRAKDDGRNAYHFFTPAMNEALNQKIILEREIRQAIENREFVVYYQPVVCGSSDTVVSCEALARWNHPTRGILGPHEFIGLAEETGLITDIGWQVIENVAQQLALWQDDPIMKFIRVAVNVSAQQLQDRELPARLRRLTDTYDVPRSLLTLEVTETLVMQRPEKAAEILEAIRAIGIRVALDDFGTGYSSLNYLKRFSFDVLKIDRSFVMDLENDQSDAALVEAIIVMAHKLGIAVIAEGVETAWQKKYIFDMDCDYIQGYFYSRPLNQEHFFEFCNNFNGHEEEKIACQ